VLPQNRQQLAAISGIGDQKLEKYGDDILELIKNAASDLTQ
jgi:superfamily II DNA helicase RecQ